MRKKLASEPQDQERRTVVRVAVSAASDLEAQLQVKYQVPNAAWHPRYEARLDLGSDGGGSVQGMEIIRRAEIAQHTGEAWENVALTLSTTQPARGTAAPRLPTLRLEFQSEKKERRVGGLMSLDGFRDQSAPAPAELEADEQAVGRLATGLATHNARVARKVAKVKATISANAFQASYAIPGRATVETGGAKRVVRIDAVSPEAALERRAVPARARAAYLYTKMTLPKGLRLLAGPVALFRDGVFVGNGRIPQLIGGEDHDLGFGIDDAIRVQFAKLERQTGESGTFSTSKTEVQRFKVTLESLHDAPVSVRVIDRVPVAGDEDIKVRALGKRPLSGGEGFGRQGRHHRLGCGVGKG